MRAEVNAAPRRRGGSGNGHLPPWVAPVNRSPIQAVIFDLDGVIVSTDECHYQAWKELADELGLPFDRAANEALRGVSRMASLDLVLGQRSRDFSESDKAKLAEGKNVRYRALLEGLGPADILPGVLPLIDELRSHRIKMAIGSSSKNAPVILERIGLAGTFDAVVDGNRITHSKPDPEVFLTAAVDLALDPAQCVVVEDAIAGVDAATAAGMPVLAVSGAADHPRATWRAPNLAGVRAADFGIH